MHSVSVLMAVVVALTPPTQALEWDSLPSRVLLAQATDTERLEQPTHITNASG